MTPRDSVDHRGPKSLGVIVGLSWRLYLGNFPTLLGLSLVAVPLQMLVGTIQDQVGSEDTQGNLIGLLFLPSLVVSLVSASALIFASNDVISGARPDFGRSIDAAFSRLGATISSFLLALVLAICFVIALPYFATRWQFEAQAVMIEGRRNWSALDASSSIVKGRWWRTFGISLFLVAPLYPIALIQARPDVRGLVPLTFLGIAVSLVVPYLLMGQTLLYYDLKARKQDDLSADRLTAAEPDIPGESP